MYRKAMEELAAWKDSPTRKPLLLEGARQVGKTWLALELGRTGFTETAHVDFLDNQPMQALFAGSLETERLLTGIAAATGKRAGDEDVLIVLDEIQECPRALTSLKIFCERRPDVPIIAAGSLLGVAMHAGTSFPVGKVDFLRLFPLTFDEFLLACGKTSLCDLLASQDASLMDAFAESFTDELRRYYFVGGMPEAVSSFVSTGELAAARTVHETLISGYERDFSKHAGGVLAERIRDVWQSAPAQLARENRKFVYSAVRPGARARGYEEAIRWLVDAGLMLRVERVSKPGLPLSAYADRSSFKLFLLDVGLLGALSRLAPEVIIDGNRLFTEFKGVYAEQFVLQQFAASPIGVPRYWSAANSSGEVDFLFDCNGKVVPVEVKAETNLKSKSLSSFARQFGIDRSLRLSLAGWADQGWVVNVPLFAANLLPDDLPEGFSGV